MRLLAVIDYQNDFVNGSLGFEGAEKLEELISRKIDAYRKAGDEVVFTLDTHGEDYLDTREGKMLPIKHCIKGMPGHDFFGNIRPLDGEKIFEKETFGSREFFDYIRKREYESIELVGLVSNICVISNAVLAKTAAPEIPVIVDSTATASADLGLHKKALDVMRGLQIEVL